MSRVLQYKAITIIIIILVMLLAIVVSNSSSNSNRLKGAVDSRFQELQCSDGRLPQGFRV